jgi:hypothetical protein
MHSKWCNWQQEAGADSALEVKLSALRKQKNSLRTEVCYLEYECHRLYSLYSDVRLALGRAKWAYQQVDYQMALNDGRLTVIDEIRLEQLFSQKTKDLLNSLSAKERKALIEELETLEEEDTD